MSNAAALRAVDMQQHEFPRGVLLALLVAWPFLFPFVAGPSTGVWQLLASWSCVALMVLVTWATGTLKSPSMPLSAWLVATALLVLLGSGALPQSMFGALLAVGVMGLAACTGATLALESSCKFSIFNGLAKGLLAAGLVSALLGLLQYYGLADPLVPWTTAPDVGQAYGNLRQRNQFASLINIALIAALWFYATSASRQQRAWLQAAGVLLVVAQAAATSRTGLLQLVCIAGVCAFIARQERRRKTDAESFRLPHHCILLAMIPLYFAIGWLLPHLASSGVEGMGQRLREGAPPGHSRLLLWHNVATLIGQHPWRGWGWGELSFAHYTTLYDGPRFVEILDNAHNLPLQLAVELGIPAAVLICGGFTWLVVAAKPWRESDPARLMVWGVLGVVVLHSLLEYPLWYGPFQVVFGLCLGILWQGGQPPKPKANTMAARLAPLLAAVVLMVGIAYAACDYLRISQIYLSRQDRFALWREDTLAKIDHSWLFANQVAFARLTLTPVTRANAAEVHALAEHVLHFSPEPRVISKLIESATLLKLDDEATAQAERFRIAFPVEYRHWLAGEPMTDPPPH
jgi:O-antigen ligase